MRKFDKGPRDAPQHPSERIDAQMQRAALALSPQIPALDRAELAANAAENFDADRPWQSYKARLPGGR